MDSLYTTTVNMNNLSIKHPSNVKIPVHTVIDSPHLAYIKQREQSLPLRLQDLPQHQSYLKLVQVKMTKNTNVHFAFNLQLYSQFD